MCGIAGLYDFTDKHIDKSEIVSMTETLSHRGPNGQGFFWTELQGLDTEGCLYLIYRMQVASPWCLQMEIM